VNRCDTCGSDLLVPPADSRPQQALSRIELLSPREFDVFVLLRDGPSNRDISRRIHIAERTAKAHVASLLEKLGLESRLQLGMTSLLHGAQRHCRHSHVPMANGHRGGWPVEIEAAG
jgi:DNA-binding NarL/FixJ family response regulator